MRAELLATRGAELLVGLALAGGLLLLARRTPRGAATFALALSLLGGALLLAGAAGPSPGAHAVSSPAAADLIRPVLVATDPMLLLDNLPRVGPAFALMPVAAALLRAVLFLFDALPIALAAVAAFLFARSFWPLGRGGTRTLGRELLAALCLAGALVAITAIALVFLAQLVAPAMQTLSGAIVLAFVYLQADAAASPTLALMSLVGLVAHLVLDLAAVAVASGLYLARVQTIFRQRFHDHVPLSAHRTFWRRGTLALLWAQLLPLLFALAAAALVDWKVGRLFRADHPSLIGAMAAVAALLALGLPAVFALARGVRALRFLAGYRRRSAPAAA